MRAPHPLNSLISEQLRPFSETADPPAASFARQLQTFLAQEKNPLRHKGTFNELFFFLHNKHSDASHPPALQRLLRNLYLLAAGLRYHSPSLSLCTATELADVLDIDATSSAGQNALITQARTGNRAARILLFGCCEHFRYTDGASTLTAATVTYVCPDTTSARSLNLLSTLALYNHPEALAQCKRATVRDIEQLAEDEQEDFYEIPAIEKDFTFIWSHAMAGGHAAKNCLPDYHRKDDALTPLKVSHLTEIIRIYRKRIIFWPTSSNMKQVIRILEAANRAEQEWFTDEQLRQLSRIEWRTYSLTASHLAQTHLNAWLNPDEFAEALAFSKEHSPKQYADYVTWIVTTAKRQPQTIKKIFTPLDLEENNLHLLFDCLANTTSLIQERHLLDCFLAIALAQNRITLISKLIHACLKKNPEDKVRLKSHENLLLVLLTKAPDNLELLLSALKLFKKFSAHHRPEEMPVSEIAHIVRQIGKNGTAEMQYQAFTILHDLVHDSLDFCPRSWLHTLAQCYEHGWGCSKDSQRATEILRDCRAQGDLVALDTANPHATTAELFSLAKAGDYAAYLRLEQAREHKPSPEWEAEMAVCAAQFPPARPTSPHAWNQRAQVRLFNHSSEHFIMCQINYCLAQIGRCDFTYRWHGRDLSTSGLTASTALSLSQSFCQYFNSDALPREQSELWQAAIAAFVANPTTLAAINPTFITNAFSHHQAVFLPRAGWHGHSIGIQLFRVGEHYYLSYENRGDHCGTEPGSHFFQIKNIDALTDPEQLAAWQQKLTSRDFVSDLTAHGNGLGKALNLQPVAYWRQSYQKAGNCTIMACNNAIMIQLLSQRLNRLGITSVLDQDRINAAMHDIIPIYKHWRLHARSSAIQRFCQLGIPQTNGTHLDAKEHAKILAHIIQYATSKYPHIADDEAEHSKRMQLITPITTWLTSVDCPYDADDLAHLQGLLSATVATPTATDTRERPVSLTLTSPAIRTR